MTYDAVFTPEAEVQLTDLCRSAYSHVEHEAAARLGADLAVIHEGTGEALNPVSAFDLASIRGLYSEFLERFAPSPGDSMPAMSPARKPS